MLTHSLPGIPKFFRDMSGEGLSMRFNLNNAVDHSEGDKLLVQVIGTAVDTMICLRDNGVGIFRKIQSAMNLLDERHAVLELAKGKLTTDPKRHTGQGIFFTSRLLDSFDIWSGGVFFTHKFGSDEYMGTPGIQ